MSGNTFFLPYGRHKVDDCDVEAVITALRSSYLTGGPEVILFEEALARATGAPFAIAVSSGTTALHLAYMAHELKADDAVIVPAITFVATANAAKLCGAEVEFADVAPETGLMSPEHAQAAIDRAKQRGLTPRLLVPVHLGGQAENPQTLAEVASSAGLAVIEDACHSLGGRHGDGTPVGSGRRAAAACFSFHAVKTIAMGEGGAVTTADPRLARAIRRLRDHGLERSPENMSETSRENGWPYEMQQLGLNARASDIACALGRSQIGRLGDLISERERLARLYDRHLSDLRPHLQPVPRSPGLSGWHLYRVLIDFKSMKKSRPTVIQKLRELGIGTQVHYIPVVLQPYYQQQCDLRHFPGAMAHYEQCLTLPLFSGLTEDDIRRVRHAFVQALA